MVKEGSPSPELVSEQPSPATLLISINQFGNTAVTLLGMFGSSSVLVVHILLKDDRTRLFMHVVLYI